MNILTIIFLSSIILFIGTIISVLVSLFTTWLFRKNNKLWWILIIIVIILSIIASILIINQNILIGGK